MTDQQHTSEQNEALAIIPPYYLLILGLVGIVVAIIVGFTQPTFTVVGWGGLGVALLSFVAWVLMAPDEARAVVTGRTVRYGGTSIVITAIVLFALIALYVVIREQNWQFDLTERDTFSLTAEVEAAMIAMGADPTLPEVRVLAFYSGTMAGRRDQDTLLLDDYQRASAGKISYEFVDPDRNPLLAENLGVRPGGLYVSTLEENGEIDTENGEALTFLNQEQLTNAILRVSVAGDFRAYILDVNNGLRPFGADQDGMINVTNILEQQYDWGVRSVTPFELTAAESGVTLNSDDLDGEVLVIPGGDTALTTAEVDLIIDYLDNGGKVAIFATPSTNPDSTSLATTPELNNYLWENFGVRFNDQIVLDLTQNLGSPLLPVTSNVSRTNVATSSLPSGGGLVFNAPNSIEIAETLPANVTVEPLATSTNDAYAKPLDDLLNEIVDRSETDPVGPFVLMAAVENSETGARLILSGSTSLLSNAFSIGNLIYNGEVSAISLAWITGFDEYVSQVTVQSAQRPQDTPIVVDQQTSGTINLITTFLLPFGVLAIGLLVWLNNRETAL